MAVGNNHLQVVKRVIQEFKKREVKDIHSFIDKQNADGNTPLRTL
jgi:hypothetical protein